MQAFRKIFLVAMVLAAVLAACAPAQSPQQVQGTIDTAVAMTVQAQNDMSTSVASTLTAQAPLPSATATPTLIPVVLPTLTPILDPNTATAFVVQPSGGGGSGGGSAPAAKYACSFSEVKPRINIFKLGDPIDVVWIITNTGTKNWADPVEIDYYSGTKFTDLESAVLPALKSGDRTTLSFEGNAPNTPGYYEMKFKVSQGYCFPYIDIQAIKPTGQDP